MTLLYTASFISRNCNLTHSIPHRNLPRTLSACLPSYEQTPLAIPTESNQALIDFNVTCEAHFLSEFFFNWPFSIENTSTLLSAQFYEAAGSNFSSSWVTMIPLQDTLGYHLEWEMCKRIIRTGNLCSPQKVNCTGDELVLLQYIKWYINDCICKNCFKTLKKCHWFTGLLWNKCHFFLW